MSYLSKDLYDNTQKYIDGIIHDLAGLRVEVSSDLHAWKRLHGDISKPFDPDLNDIRPSEVFWIGVYSGNTLVACGGGRVVVCEDFIKEYLTTYLLFGDIQPSLESMDYRFVTDGPVLSGRVGYGGGVWVHPSYTGKGLAKTVSHLGKVIALRRLRVDHYTALLKHSRECWALTVLGWSHGCHLTAGHYLGKDASARENLDFFWMDAREIADLAGTKTPEANHLQLVAGGNSAAGCL